MTLFNPTEHQFQQLITDLSIISGPVNAQDFTRARVTGSKAGSKELFTSERQADPAYWQRRWDNASLTRRAMIYAELEGYIDGLKRGRRPEDTDAQDRYWVIQEYEGTDARVVASETKFSLERVKELRRIAGRTVEHGRPKAR